MTRLRTLSTRPSYLPRTDFLELELTRQRACISQVLLSTSLKAKAPLLGAYPFSWYVLQTRCRVWHRCAHRWSGEESWLVNLARPPILVKNVHKCRFMEKNPKACTSQCELGVMISEKEDYSWHICFPFEFFFSFFLRFRATPEAYGDSQARGPTGATAASHSHSHTRSEPRLRPTPQLMATPDP